MSDDANRLSAELSDPAQLQREILIHNEQTKLLANAFDRAATAVFSVGVLAPIANCLCNKELALSWDRLAAWFTVWTIGAVALHSVARRLLGGLI